jgi:uncharacterized hydrophobic protein (TIGR00271 family)
MLLLRVVVPADLSAALLTYLEELDVVSDIVHIAGAGRRPAGDLVQCLVAIEAASAVVSGMRGMGVHERGSITLDRLDATVSWAAREAGERAPGLSADAVVWEEVESRVEAVSVLSASFLIYMMAATIIAAVAIITDSVVLLVGAMVVGPEFGPLAGLCVGVVQRRRDLLRHAAISTVVGFALAVAAAFVATWAFRAGGVAPEELTAQLHPATLFISRPDAYSVVIAAMSGVAGMLSLTTGSNGTLIGVLISVTTMPAAANLGVAMAYGNRTEASGAALQLAVNLGVLLAAGLVTLLVQRSAFTRRVGAAVERVGRLRLRARR